MTEETIAKMTLPELLQSKNIYEIQEQPPEIREQLKALFFVKLDELKASNETRRQIQAMFKQFHEADNQLAKEYARINAQNNSTLPLIFDGHGKPMATIDNFLMILRNDAKFETLRLNLLSYAPEHTVDGKIERWSDKDDSETRLYIEKKYKIHNKEKLDDALRVLFSERAYHPIKKIIEAVNWDGKPRIQSLFIKWLKCEDTPYTREVTRLVFAGGINRLYNPGCKFDDVCVLIGTKQGEGKSTFVRWLALRDDFFTEVTEIDGQKGMEAIEGAWICEIAELLALTKAKEVEAVKSYITKMVDRYRKPFDRRTSDYKRQCIFIGTTNKEQFLTDKTGNRRFYPLKVNQSGYDLYSHKEEVQDDILQCWAEAKAKLGTDEMQPFANIALINDIRLTQQDAVEDDYRTGMVASYLENKDEVCVIEIWDNVLGDNFRKPTKRESNEISLILQSLGVWERSKKAKRTEKYGVQKVWHRKKLNDVFFEMSECEGVDFSLKT